MTEQEKTKDEVSLVKCTTSAGAIAMEFHREWSPNGYDRAIELFERGFYDNSHFFRVVPKFLVQFGISYSTDAELQKFAHAAIPDDSKHEPVIPFEEGTISYAGSGDNSRTSQLFISYGHSTSLGTQKWETPLGKVIEGMGNVRNLYSYGDGPPFGDGPAQGKIHSGRRYIEENFPLLDHFITCTVKRGVAPQQKLVHSRRIRDEDHQVKEHKRPMGGETNVGVKNRAKRVHGSIPRLNETHVEGYGRTTLFATFASITLIVLLVFGYRHSGKKGRKSS